MNDFFLNIWYRLTGQARILVQDVRLANPKKKWIYRDEYKQWLQETNKIYEEELRARENREVEFIWCLVGNIIGEHPVGENKAIKRGTKHFSSGTKVYCFPPKWGDGYEKIYVIGRPRQSLRFIKVIIKSEFVTNWRMQKVYSNHIKRDMIKNHGWDETEESKHRVETLLKSILKNRGLNEHVNKRSAR
jgi:hypothetical protein